MFKTISNMSLIIVIFLICVTGNAIASSLNHLYDIEVKVNDSSDEAKNEAIPDAFKLLLKKISGSTAIYSDPLVEQAINKADSYVTQFSFETSSDITLLKLKFNKKMIRELLSHTNQPVLDKERPITVLWISLEKEGKTELIHSEENTSISEILENFSKVKALPIFIPILDISEVNEVTALNVASFDIPVLEKSLENYGANALLVIKLVENPYGINGECMYIIKGVKQSWLVKGDNLSQTLKSALKHYKSQIFEQYTLTHSLKASGSTEKALETLSIHIHNVETTEQYLSLMRYLKNLTLIHNVQIKQILPTEVQLYVQIKGTKTQWLRSIHQGGFLNVIPQNEQAPNVLMFKLESM